MPVVSKTHCLVELEQGKLEREERRDSRAVGKMGYVACGDGSVTVSPLSKNEILGRLLEGLPQVEAFAAPHIAARLLYKELFSAVPPEEDKNLI